MTRRRPHVKRPRTRRRCHYTGCKAVSVSTGIIPSPVMMFGVFRADLRIEACATHQEQLRAVMQLAEKRAQVARQAKRKGGKPDATLQVATKLPREPEAKQEGGSGGAPDRDDPPG